jgi:Ca2+-binding RTX toxin-like protein
MKAGRLGVIGVASLAMAAAGVLGVVPAASAAPARCTIVGTPGDDVIRGTSGDDVICGLGGNDRIWGLLGDDILRGGAGDDELHGGPGDDVLDGKPDYTIGAKFFTTAAFSLTPAGGTECTRNVAPNPLVLDLYDRRAVAMFEADSCGYDSRSAHYEVRLDGKLLGDLWWVEDTAGGYFPKYHVNCLTTKFTCQWEQKSRETEGSLFIYLRVG